MWPGLFIRSRVADRAVTCPDPLCAMLREDPLSLIHVASIVYEFVLIAKFFVLPLAISIQ